MLLDTNCLLRYLLCDNQEQADMVAGEIAKGATTLPECLAECVYVLTGRVYGLSREAAAGALLELLRDVDCEHRETMARALEIFSESTLDFVDCDLVARKEVERMGVLTFDKRLMKMLSR